MLDRGGQHLLPRHRGIAQHALWESLIYTVWGLGYNLCVRVKCAAHTAQAWKGEWGIAFSPGRAIITQDHPGPASLAVCTACSTRQRAHAYSAQCRPGCCAVPLSVPWPEPLQRIHHRPYTCTSICAHMCICGPLLSLVSFEVSRVIAETGTAQVGAPASFLSGRVGQGRAGAEPAAPPHLPGLASGEPGRPGRGARHEAASQSPWNQIFTQPAGVVLGTRAPHPTSPPPPAPCLPALSPHVCTGQASLSSRPMAWHGPP